MLVEGIVVAELAAIPGITPPISSVIGIFCFSCAPEESILFTADNPESRGSGDAPAPLTDGTPTI